jgi:glycosyltransferase involved in cell wall biosynthesis
MKLTISIVTPSFNQAEFIERTILSVLEQDAPPTEYVIFDGGSTDNTITILKKHQDRLRWVSEKDNGQAHAVNKGIKATSGDVIGWINSDDIYYPGTFKTVLECFEKYPDVNVIYGNAHHIDEKDNILEPYYTEKWDYERLKDICFLCQPTVFFRRSVVEKVGLLDEALQYCMDYEYWLRAGAESEFHYLSQTLAGSRMYNENKTLGARTKVHEEICDMLHKQIGQVPSKWVFAYAHAIADEQDYNRSDPWQNTCYCSTLLTESSKKFLKLNGEITIKDMRTMSGWIGGAHSEFLKNEVK